MQLNLSNYRGTKRLKMSQILANSGYVFRLQNIWLGLGFQRVCVPSTSQVSSCKWKYRNELAGGCSYAIFRLDSRLR